MESIVVGLMEILLLIISRWCCCGGCFPKEGAIFPWRVCADNKGSTNLENAKKFVDYMLYRKGTDDVASQLTVRPLRKGLLLADYMTPLEEIKLFDKYDEGWVSEK